MQIIITLKNAKNKKKLRNTEQKYEVSLEKNKRT